RVASVLVAISRLCNVWRQASIEKCGFCNTPGGCTMEHKESKPMATGKFDVCVVGSGPGGGIAVYALAAAGLKVALVEAGPRLRGGIDYNSHSSPYSNLEQRVSQGLAPAGGSGNLFGDRRERNHFTGVGDRPDHGLLKAVGGRSLCWA